MALESQVRLDGIDWRILEELQRNARITFSELGRRVSLTPPAVGDRVRRLEEAGVVKGFRADLDHAMLGLPITAFVRMRAANETTCRELGERAHEFDEILECHRVTGDDSYIAKVAVRSVGHLEGLIDRLMPYAETITSLVLSAPVTNRVLTPVADEDEEERREARSA